MSWTHSVIPRRRRRLLLNVLVSAAVLLTWRWYAATPAAPTAKHVLITTPGNTTYPFHRLSTSDWTPTPLQVAFDDAFFPTHVIAHPMVQNIYLATNEVDRGSIIAVRLDGDSVLVVGRAASAGRQPAHCAIVGEHLICANYNSPTISLHTLLPGPPYVSHQTTYTVPVTPHFDSHPHQIIPSPVDDSLFYVPDLGQNCVHVVRADGKGLKAVQKWTAPAGLGLGPRHGVVTPDGTHLILAFQTSSTIASIPIHPGGVLVDPTEPSSHTLPALFRYSSSSFALSDIHLVGSTVYVLNRLVVPPFGGEGDTISLFTLKDGALREEGHIQLPCYQPREMTELGQGRFGVTCIGGDGKGGGLVAIKDGKVGRYWPGVSSWGLVGVM